MTKILDLDPGICDYVRVEFHPEDWPEFDRTVKWLIENGVPLARRNYQTYEMERVFIGKRQRPYIKGEIVMNSHQKMHGSLEAEEGVGVRYEVFYPDMLRR